jgi:2'-hydroxyisoflavone reductase
MMDRRRFLFGSLAAAGAAGLASCAPSQTPPAPAPTPTPKVAATPPSKKKILILGGTNFLGPHVVDAAIARGHTVTLFNRGKTHAELYPDLEKLRGDRDGHLEALQGRSWDAVVDPSGYVPRIVTMSAQLLAPNVGHYVFISTISVYHRDNVVGDDETAPVETIADPTNEDVKTNYGALKALCEQAAERAMPGRVANIRPGLIVGPGDPTGRFTHWPWRASQGGEMIGPGDGTTPTQWIDGRDLGAWIVKVIEDKTVGVYNAMGPATRYPMKSALDACNEAAGNKAQITWVDGDFLTKHAVQGWSDMPMWIDNKGDDAGFGTMKNERAVAKGLAFRPCLDTARDTLAWLQTLPADQQAKVRSSGIKPEKEAEVLAAWHAKT